MAKIKCNCGKTAKTRIYVDSELGSFTDKCEDCAAEFRKEMEESWDDMNYRQGRSKEHYRNNLRTMDLVFLLGSIAILILLIIETIKTIF
jgi:hypothetical protein